MANTEYAQCIVVYACIELFHALHACISSVSKKNTVHKLCFITEFPKKLGGGGKCITGPPNPFFVGAMAPLAPPCGGPHVSHIYEY